MNISRLFLISFSTVVLLLGAPGTATASSAVGFTFEIVGDTNAVVPPNLPIMRLTNDSSTATLTSFSISIGNTDFHFATIAQTFQEVVEEDPSTDLMFSPPNSGTVRIDIVDFMFTGFDPGDRFKFQSDIDQDAPPQNVALDFQTLLFNNGNGVPNSVLTADFSSGETLVLTMDENPIPVSGDGSTAFPFAYMFSASTSLNPIDAIGELIALVINLNINNGISNSLDAKLDAAINALDDMNESNDGAAVNTLQAFINAVEAQSGNQIDEADACNLIQCASEIIVTLGGTYNGSTCSIP